MPANPHSFRLFQPALRDVMLTVASYGLRGLDVFGMLAVTSASVHETVRSLCTGVRLSQALYPNRPYALALLRAYRAAVVDMLRMVEERCLADLDAVIVEVECGARAEAAPAHDRVTGADVLLGPVPDVEEVRKMYEATTAVDEEKKS